MNLYLTKNFTFLRQGSYEIPGGSAPPPLISDVGPKQLVSEGLKEDLVYNGYSLFAEEVISKSPNM